MDYLKDLGLAPSRNPLEDLNALFLLFYLYCFYMRFSSYQTRIRIRDREGGSSVDGALAYDCSWTFSIVCEVCTVVHAKTIASLAALVVM